MINIEVLEKIDRVFKRYEGWSGSDGVYTFSYRNEILWYFSDTFVGRSTSQGKRINPVFIHNSMAISSREITDIRFLYRRNPIESMFSAQEGYYWLQDGSIEDEHLYIFALKMKNSVSDAIPFEIAGVDLLSVNLPVSDHSAFSVRSLPRLKGGIILGASVLKDRDFYYIHGYIDGRNKKLILARTRDFLNLNLEYLSSDRSWKKEPESLKILKDNFAAECRFVKIKDYYYCAYTKGSVGADIYLLRCRDLTEEYRDGILIYRCPEHRGTLICYNAKIQSPLSDESTVTVAYHVNSLRSEELENLDIYRPRFIRFDLKEAEHEFEKQKKK